MLTLTLEKLLLVKVDDSLQSEDDNLFQARLIIDNSGSHSIFLNYLSRKF
mgnify:CR=1 FL=1